MLTAEPVADVTDVPVALLTAVEFVVVKVVRGTEDQMVVDMVFLYVRCDDIGVFIFRELRRKLLAYEDNWFANDDDLDYGEELGKAFGEVLLDSISD